jgi:hypothetical protein
MLSFEAKKGVEFCDGLTRRDFLRVGAATAGAVSLALPDLVHANAARSDELSCILLFLVGGPSHLDTFDPKPNAPANVRGPFRPIATSVPGVQICEHLPLMARRADRFALVRSVHHTSAPIHETGHQWMQTGRLFRNGAEHPHYGAVLSHLRGERRGAPPFVVTPGPIRHTGVSVSHGQGAGYLGSKHAPAFPDNELAAILGVDPARLSSRNALLDAVDDVERCFDANGPADTVREPSAHRLFSARSKRAFDIAAERDSVRDNYGRNTFGQSCLLARRLVEGGVRLVTVNMFDTVFNELTWDCHADGGSLSVRLDDYAATLCPMLDRAYTALLDDLEQRGMLETTLVLALGEFGRTPQLNPRGGRDHWPGCWSIVFAGGGVRGGQVIGASDATGSEPKERPVSPAEVAASVYHALGIDPATKLPGPDGRLTALTDAGPIHELFRG